MDKTCHPTGQPTPHASKNKLPAMDKYSKYESKKIYTQRLQTTVTPREHWAISKTTMRRPNGT